MVVLGLSGNTSSLVWCSLNFICVICHRQIKKTVGRLTDKRDLHLKRINRIKVFFLIFFFTYFHCRNPYIQSQCTLKPPVRNSPILVTRIMPCRTRVLMRTHVLSSRQFSLTTTPWDLTHEKFYTVFGQGRYVLETNSQFDQYHYAEEKTSICWGWWCWHLCACGKKMINSSRNSLR